MMLLNGSGIFPILLFIFIGWVFVADSPELRLSRACAPTQWVGKVAVSATDLTLPQYSQKTGEIVNDIDYSCQYTLLRLFYDTPPEDTTAPTAPTEDIAIEITEKPEEPAELIYH